MEELYNLLLQDGITPNVITYNTMLFAFGKAGRFAKMDNFFQQMLHDSNKKGTSGVCDVGTGRETQDRWTTKGEAPLDRPRVRLTFQGG